MFPRSPLVSLSVPYALRAASGGERYGRETGERHDEGCDNLTNLPSLRVLFTGYTVSLLRYSFRYQCCPSPYWTGLLSTVPPIIKKECQ